MPIDAVLYDMSYQNLMLYCRAIPHYDDEKEKEWDESLDANNPNNFKTAKAEETFYKNR